MYCIGHMNVRSTTYFHIQIQNNFISYNTLAYEIYYEPETLLGLLVSVMTHNAFQLWPLFGFSNMLVKITKQQTIHIYMPPWILT